MMKKNIVILFFGLLFPLMAFSQTDVALGREWGGRLSVSVDKKITKGLHVSLEEEARFDNNFGDLDRLQTTLTFSYKVHPNIKFGLGYALLNDFGAKSGSFKSPRHRLLFDATGSIHYGNWNFSLKERFQVTRRSGEYNIYQNPRNALMLKSRITARYKGFGRVQPYAYFEVRNYLNAPVIAANYDGTYYVPFDYDPNDDDFDVGDPGWFLTGFNGSYVNRLRGSLGVDVKLDKRSTLNFYFLSEYIINKEVDANASGTKLKSYTKETGFCGWFGAGYEFAF